MEDKPHPVVELLLARMESHPEEFKRYEGPYNDRWYDHVNTINAYGNEADKAALATGLREIRLGEVHEQVMDELLNGDERRRKAEEAEEQERNLLKSNLAQQQLAAHQNAMHRYKNAVGQLGQYNQLGQYSQAQSIGIVGKPPSGIWMDESADIGISTQSPSQPLTVGTGGKEIMRIKADGGVLTQPNLSSSAINQIKKALKF